MNIEEIKQQRKESFCGSHVVSDWQNNAYLMGIDDALKYGMPDIETVSALVHEAWMKTKADNNVFSRKAEDGEELIAPYSELSEKAKDLDRNTVKAVYAAIFKANSSTT